MPDMLVKLYELPPLDPVIAEQAAHGITIRRAMAPEKHLVIQWVTTHFSAVWGSEADKGINQAPPTCWLATERIGEKDSLVGFACYDTTGKGFFGPIGVSEVTRGRGTGKALLIATLHAMYFAGYGYAVIGGAGPTGFYEKAVGAIAIADSSPGVYKGMLRENLPE